jgi:hypothetical protein
MNHNRTDKKDIGPCSPKQELLGVGLCPSKFICQGSHLQRNCILVRKYLRLNEVMRFGAQIPQDECHVLIGDIRDGVLTLLSLHCEKGCRRLRSGKRASPDTKQTGALILDFTASTIAGNKCSLFEPPVWSVWYLLW